MSGTQENISSVRHSRAIHEEDLIYWKTQLSSVAAYPDVPTDHSRSSGVTQRVEVYESPFSRTQNDQLQAFCKETGIDAYLVLLSTFKVLLYRYVNQEDILIGTSKFQSSGSHYVKDGVLKIRENRSIVRTNFSGDPFFLELMQRVNDSLSEAEAHQSAYFFENFIVDLDREGVDVNSAFRIGFEFCKTPWHPNLPLAPQTHVDRKATELLLRVQDTTDAITFYWNYDSGLYLESTIQRIANHFQNLLTGIIANPNERISKLQLLSTHERLRILYEWNDTATRYQDDKCIHELFEEQVRHSPNALALETYEPDEEGSLPLFQKLSYRRLNERANQLAHFLIQLGVGADVVVGVCIKRSPEMVIAILGILKAGGAYLPMDPVHPSGRLGFMINDSGISILITEHSLLHKVSNHPVQLICLDEDFNMNGEFSDSNPGPRNTPDNLAYVIYTSGSTGVPKGTLIVHKGVVNYLSWCTRAYAVSKGSGAPINSSIAFDATVTSFFAPLLTGKKLVLLPEVQEIEALRNVLISGNRFSLVKITPAHLEILKHLLPPGEITTKVNALVIGGEALVASHLEFWQTHAPNTRLINEYGPTETVVGCSMYEVSALSNEMKDVPIGRPIANMQMYILDRQMEPVPIGVTGEIYIGGEGLARGYLNRPELTEQRFVANPFTDQPGERLYKTGDLGRYLADGNIVYLGRIDHQVKIRGYRIELGEIETALRKHPAVTRATVIAQTDNSEKRLVAYLVTGDQSLTTHHIQIYLGAILPEYMIPAAFVFLENLPITPNGKVDRNALPVPDRQNGRWGSTYIGPRDKTETQLTEIFQDSLHMQRIGVTENFFDLGGSSIQAASLFSKIRKVTGKQLPISTLIANPTVERLAIFLKNKNTAGSCVVPIQTEGTRPPLFFMHAGAGTVLLYRSLAIHLGADQPVYGLQAKGLNGHEVPHTRIEDMAQHYISEIRKVQTEGPYYLAGYCLGAILAFEMAQQLTRDGQEVALLASFNGVSPTYVEPRRGPRMRESDKTEEDNPKVLPLHSSAAKKFSASHLKARFVYIRKAWPWILQSKLRKIGYQFFITFNQPLPHSLGKYYFLETNASIAKIYVPQVYPGKMLIFYSPGIYEDPNLGWSNFITDEIKNYPISGDHKNRREIMNEPFVQELAKHLQPHLPQKISGG